MAKDKIDLVVDRIDDLKESTEKRLDSIDFNLAEHMRRTDVLEKLHRDNQTRIESLEEPQKAMEFIKRVIVYVGVVAAGIVSVVKLLEYLP